ncbi:acetate kinase [Pseudothauera rhizosphaerae]|uniref:Acetate kinase n=1 Tax=Pseudothauera rhizosphaerae TaxID=2565932 RepID=A0A4S4ATW8_9RHOO|nr:acetate kinase [Pseudothauera rhizosphaerae]THF63379.1 acetate kinase [Pseudothauera rhizosphaerae]
MKTPVSASAAIMGHGLAGALLVLGGSAAQAADDGAGSVSRLQEQVDEQAEQIRQLKESLLRQNLAINELQRMVQIDRITGRGAAPAGSYAPRREQLAQASQQGEAPPQPVGQAPEQPADSRPPEVAPIFEQPGVLTPRGKWIVEPSLQYSYSSSNRIALIGYTIIPAILIGLIDVREVKSNSFVAALTVRRGITNRLELEAKVPWVYRSDDTISREVFTGSADERVFDTTGSGLGDVEVTGRYQLNDGGVDSPYYIASLRLKTRTGKDPFEVKTVFVPGAREGGMQTEMPTGSGFYTLTPGLTVLIPSDPAVFFGGVSYQHSFKRGNVKTRREGGSVLVGDVKPGPTFGFNFGMGLALNERSSFSIGYDHLSVGKVEVDGNTAPGSVRVQLGTLLLGYSYRTANGQTLNLSLGAGLTTDTPDLQLTLRMPLTL